MRTIALDNCFWKEIKVSVHNHRSSEPVVSTNASETHRFNENLYIQLCSLNFTSEYGERSDTRGDDF